MANRRVCQTLEKSGDALTIPREIDHWIYFPTERARDIFIPGATQAGYAIRSLSAGAEDGRYCARMTRSDIPSFAGIDDVTRHLFDLAQQCGGEYDGWESEVKLTGSNPQTKPGKPWWNFFSRN